jgi:dephospho-CoA kinase
MMDEVKPKVVAIVGMAGSGKTTVREVFEKQGYQNIYFGGIVLDEVKRRGYELTEENERPVREELRANEGMDVLAKRSIPKIDELLSSGSNVVIDDLYSFSSVKLLQATYGEQVRVLAVVAPRSMRYKRLKSRKVRPFTREEAINRDIAEIDYLEKGGPISFADYYILNEGSIESVRKKAEEIVTNIN